VTELIRCWPTDDPLYIAYHDEEWGRPLTDEHGLYERLCLEGFQAGLAWITILRKREAFRKGFAGFDPEGVARFGERDVERLIPEPAAPIVLYCGGGFRSALAADNLQKMGYTNVVSMDGGMRAWREAGYPIEKG